MSKFKIGEVAILQNFTGFSAYLNGMECEVTGCLDLHTAFNEEMDIIKTFMGYEIKVCNGEVLYQETFYLRKKQPPEDDIDWVEKLNLTVDIKKELVT